MLRGLCAYQLLRESKSLFAHIYSTERGWEYIPTCSTPVETHGGYINGLGLGQPRRVMSLPSQLTALQLSQLEGAERNTGLMTMKQIQSALIMCHMMNEEQHSNKHVLSNRPRKTNETALTPVHR